MRWKVPRRISLTDDMRFLRRCGPDNAVTWAGTQAAEAATLGRVGGKRLRIVRSILRIASSGMANFFSSTSQCSCGIPFLRQRLTASAVTGLRDFCVAALIACGDAAAKMSSIVLNCLLMCPTIRKFFPTRKMRELWKRVKSSP